MPHRDVRIPRGLSGANTRRLLVERGTAGSTQYLAPPFFRDPTMKTPNRLSTTYPSHALSQLPSPHGRHGRPRRPSGSVRVVGVGSSRERHVMDRLLTADELAERLGMKTEWVWAQARAGRIPHVRLAGTGGFGSPRSRRGFTISRPAAQRLYPAPRPTPLRRSA